MFTVMHYWVYGRTVVLDAIEDVSLDIFEDDSFSWEWNFASSPFHVSPKVLDSVTQVIYGERSRAATSPYFG